MKGYSWRHLNSGRALILSLILIAMCASVNALTCDELKKYMDNESIKKADIVLVFDTTKSMSDNIQDLKSISRDFVEKLNSSGIDYRLGLTEFDDFTGVCGGRCGGILPECGDVPYKIYNNGTLVNDVDTFNSWVNGLTLHCGGDGFESILAALNHTVNDQNWREDDVPKIAILISDSVPHPDEDCCNIEGDTLSSIESTLISSGVKLYIIGNDNGCGQIQPGWATDLATSTGGKFYNISLMESLLPGLKDIISYIEYSFNQNADARYRSNKLDISQKLTGRNGELIPYDANNTSAWVVLNCHDGTYDLTYDPLKGAYHGIIDPTCIDELGNVKLTAFAKVCDCVNSEAIEVNSNIIKVYVDIKPGLCPNLLNLKVNANIPIAILGTVDFDVKQIDPTSVRLGYNGNEIEPVKFYYADVATPFRGELCNCTTLGPDGNLDLVMEFSIPEINKSLDLPYAGTIPLTISGALYKELGGNEINGQDCVKIPDPCGIVYTDAASAQKPRIITSTCHACKLLSRRNYQRQ